MLGAPRALRAAVAQAAALHPYALDGSIHPSPRADDDAARLWERLLSAAGDEQALAAAIRALTPHGERVLVYGAAPHLDDEGGVRVLGAVYALRDPIGLRAVSLGLEMWVATDGDAAFRSAAVRYAAAHPDREIVPFLLRNGSGPLAGATMECERTGMPLVQWASLPGVGLAEFPRATRALRRFVLRPERLVATTRREGGATTVRWMSQVLNASEREACFGWYLNATWRGEWATSDAVLLVVLERYGVPAAEHSFWSGIDEGAVAAFATWAKLLELTRLLGEGEHGDRVSFWRRFLPHIRRFVSNRDEEAVLICFDRVVAVQFVKAGAATYLFSSRHLTGFKRLEAPRLYMRVLSLARVGESLGRYEQRGSRYTWQPQAESIVREVLLGHEGQETPS